MLARSPAASWAPAGPCGGEGAPEAVGLSVPTAGRRRRRKAEPALPAPGPGTPPARLRLSGPPAPRLAGGLTELRRPRPSLGKRGPKGLPAGLSRSRRVSFPATGASCERPIERKRGKVMNGPFAFKRGPRPGLPRLSVSHQKRWRGERLRLGVRRFSKLPRPPRSGTLWRSKSIAVLAPSGYEPLMGTRAGAGRTLFIREPGLAGAASPPSYEAGR